MIKNQTKKVLSAYSLWAQRRQFEQQSFRRFNERPVEFAFVFRQVARLYPKRVLDVGTGTNALPQLLRTCGCLVTAVDNIRDYWPAGMFNPHYHIIDDDITDSRLEDKFDLITCVSVLEHIQRSDEAVANMFGLLKDGGHLILTVPFSEQAYCPNVYDLEDSAYGQSASYVCQSYSRDNLTAWIQDNGGLILEQEYWQFWAGAFWTTGKQLIPPCRVSSGEKHQLTCVLIQKTKGHNA